VTISASFVNLLQYLYHRSFLFLRQRHSVGVLQHVLLLLSFLPPALAAPLTPVSPLLLHEEELRFILRKESLERVSRVMLPQMKRLLLDAARDLLLALPKQSKVL
jgi:hypothetical protein